MLFCQINGVDDAAEPRFDPESASTILVSRWGALPVAEFDPAAPKSIGKGRETVKAHEFCFRTLDSQLEVGTPHMLYDDYANRKSN